jgi:hypothetical protein
MTVFYNDKQTQTIENRVYYVRMDTTNIPDDLKGYKIIEASTPQDLLEKVKTRYRLQDRPNIRVQLWSNKIYCGNRLDTMEEIPRDCEFIWVRLLNNNN